MPTDGSEAAQEPRSGAIAQRPAADAGSSGDRGSRGAPHWARAAALAVGVVAALGLAEAVLRVVLPQAAGVTRQPLVYEPDAALGYRYRPGARGRLVRLFEVDNPVAIDAHGFHDRERAWPPPDARPRPLAVVGDSFTAALQVPVDRTWTRVLEAELAERLDAPPAAFNLGLDGSGSDVQAALVAEHLPALRPGAVLVAFYANDVLDVAQGRVYREEVGPYVIAPQDRDQAARMRALARELADRRLARFLFAHSLVARVGVYVAAGERNLWRTNVIHPGHVGDAPAVAPGRGVAGVRAAFARLAALSREHGFRLFVVPVPPRDDPPGSLVTFRRVGAPPEVAVLDVLPALEARAHAEGRTLRELYFRYDGHLTAEGNRLLGESVAEVLAPRLREAAVDAGPREAAAPAGPPEAAAPAGSGTPRAR